MITIKDFMECINYRVTGGAEFQWHCFGADARYLDHESRLSSVSIVFDCVTQEVYMLEAWDYQKHREYRWFNPEYIDSYEAEAADAKIDFKQSSEGRTFVDLDNIDDVLRIASAIANGEEYDVRVSLTIDLDDGEMFELMKLAHERDITLNQLIDNMLRYYIDENDA